MSFSILKDTVENGKCEYTMTKLIPFRYAPLTASYTAGSEIVNMSYSDDSESEDELLKTTGQI